MLEHVDLAEMPDAVIFDLYGTLIRLDRDTRPYLRLARRLCPDDPRALLEQSLRTATQGIGDLAGPLGIRALSTFEDLDDDLERDLETACVFEDAVETLRELRALGLKLALISNLATPYKAPFFKLGLAAHFDVTQFSCDSGLCKPEPEIFLRAVRRLGIPPTRTVMVGDSRRSDYDGAKAIGMDAVLLRRNSKLPGERSIASLRDLIGEIRTLRGP